MNPVAQVFIVMFATMAVGVPIPFAVGIATVYGSWLIDLPLISLAQSSYDALGSIPLMAVPLFVLAGALMERGGMARRIVDVAQALVGRYDGSLALVTVLGCMFFAALSGSGPATTAAVGGVTIPAMLRHRYDAGYAGAVAASGGALGSLIPPSNLMVVYGIVADVSIPRLFLAGVIPGILVGFGLLMVAWVIARRNGYAGATEPFSLRIFAQVAWGSKWSLAAPIIILGGIYLGAFTPTEAAGVACAYALLVGAVIYRELTWSGIFTALKSTALLCGSVVIILGPAKAFGQLMALMDAPAIVSNLVTGVTDSGFVVILIMTGILIITGMFMESFAQIILLTPLMLPAAVALGVDPVVFGIVMVLACEVGFLTPPVGANLFVAMQLSNVSLARVSLAVLPFIAPYLVAVILVTALPWLATWLPNLLYGPGR